MPKIRYGASQKAYRQSRRGYLKPRTSRSVAVFQRPKPYMSQMAFPRPMRVPMNRLRTGGFSGIELKFIDESKTDTSLVATWTNSEMDPANNCIGSVAQGDGESNRDGRRITMKSIQINGVVYRDHAAAQAACADPGCVTLLLVLDTQTNGAQLNAEDVMVGTTSEPEGFRNLQYNTRFRILWRKTFLMNFVYGFNDAAATGALGGNIHRFSIFKKVNIPVTYDNTAAGVSSITDNSIHLIGVTSSLGGGGIDKIRYESRCRFVG